MTRALQEVIERTQAHLAQLIGHELGGAGDELLDVLETIGGLGSFGLEIIEVFHRLDDFAQ